MGLNRPEGGADKIAKLPKGWTGPGTHVWRPGRTRKVRPGFFYFTLELYSISHTLTIDYPQFNSLFKHEFTQPLHSPLTEILVVRIRVVSQDRTDSEISERLVPVIEDYFSTGHSIDRGSTLIAFEKM